MNNKETNNNGQSQLNPPRLSEDAERRIEEIKKLYPVTRSAVMPALYLAQEELGSITQDAVIWVAAKLGLSPVHVMEIATFYTMYYKNPVGKYHFQVCRTLSCAIRGARKISEHLSKSFHGLQPNEVTSDGLFSFEEVECLGSCGTAPMCQINDVFFENLTTEKLDELIARIRKEQPDLRYSTKRDAIGVGLSGLPKSEVI